jgi:hypothetical protein
MNLNPVEFILQSLGITGLVALAAPRLIARLAMHRLNAQTANIGATAYKPKHMVSKQSVSAAAASVKKALTKRTREFSWIVREHPVKASKNSVVKIEAFVPAAKIAELTQHNAQNDDLRVDFTPAQMPATDIKIRVEIYQRQDGSEIVWKYLPNNQADSEARKVVLDPRFNQLLSHTNNQLVSQLNPSLISV